MFRRLLIANRGEIACRIIRSCRRLGVETVAVYSEADEDALHVREADRAILIGGPAPADSYLRIDALIEAARSSGAEAIHPGYGFLAENAELVRACDEAGIAFVGPSASTIEAMGSKAEAKRIMETAGVPVVPGHHGEDQSDDAFAAAAASVGMPLLIKPVAGGGGKGMQVVHELDALPGALEAARRTAANAFGDPGLLIERFIERPRHIEVQIFGDSSGRVIHLGERECSLQRRHQKIIEEAPSPAVDAELRARLGEAAVAAAEAVDYTGAGTVEFIMDPDGTFFFMEMNTRLQVEHPVTELVTGQDLVEWQLRVAAGEALPLSQDAVTLEGHAIEARVYAEDPSQDFLPSVGRLSRVVWPEHARVDSGVEAGDEVSIHYDPMIAKLICHGPDRAAALNRMHAALAATRIDGVKHNLVLLETLVSRDDVRQGAMDTGLVDRELDALVAAGAQVDDGHLAAAAIALFLHRADHPQSDVDPWALSDGFSNSGSRQRARLSAPAGDEYLVSLRPGRDGMHLDLGEGPRSVGGIHLRDGRLRLRLDDHDIAASVSVSGTHIDVSVDGRTRRLTTVPLFPTVAGASDDDHHPGAPMPGRIVKVHVAEGDRVEAGQPLLVLEGMKMEFTLTARMAGVVEKLRFAEGDSVEAEVPLVDIADAEGD